MLVKLSVETIGALGLDTLMQSLLVLRDSFLQPQHEEPSPAGRDVTRVANELLTALVQERTRRAWADEETRWHLEHGDGDPGFGRQPPPWRVND